jgi:peptidylprolyl isomerase
LTRPEIDQIEACWDGQETHMTQASSGDTVRIHYTGKLTEGTLFDSSEGRDPLEFKIGENKIIPKLEESIVGMAVGDKTTVEVDAENAYGPRQEEAMQTVEWSMVPDEIDLTVGNRLEATGPNGQSMVLTVVQVTEETVTLDGNHPLAGQDLVFEIELVEVLAA